MKRYGDNITKDDLFDETQGGKSEPSYLFLGGCAATYGAFPTPEKSKALRAEKKSALTSLLTWLRGQPKKEETVGL